MGTTARAFEKYHRQRSTSAYYPLTLAFTYTAYSQGKVIQRGVGETVEMSSYGVRANFPEPVLSEVTDLKLSIAWPATLDDGTRLQFVVEGRPSWDGGRLAEVLFWKYEFRTAPRRPLTVDKSAANDAFALAQAS